MDCDFNCVLKTKIENSWTSIEIGRCKVYEDRTADFKCRFVPFFPVGSVLRLYRIIGKEEVSFFEGKVYLSSSSFIRLTDVTETILDSNVKIFSSDLSINAKGKIVSTNQSHKLPFRKKNEFDINIFELSKSSLKFTSKEKSIPKESTLFVSFESPFKSEEIFCRVYEFLNISGKSPEIGEDGENESYESDVFSYLAKIESLSENDLKNISLLNQKLKSDSLSFLKAFK